MKPRIPILLLIDCEPDARETTYGVATPWVGFERFFDLLSSWRATISEKTQSDARFAWFWRADPQVELTYGDAEWPFRAYARQIEQSTKHGDALGLHTHPWRWAPTIRRWIGDFGNPNWVESCVRSSFDVFERCFGVPCRLFRFGDGWLDDRTVWLIEKLGAHVDLTMEPGSEAKLSLAKEELTTGLIPDRRRIPNYPYHPAREDFRRADSSGRTTLWIMPVSTARRPITNLKKLKKSLPDLLMPSRRTLQLNLGFETDLFQYLFDRSLFAMRQPYVAICVRTDVGSHKTLFNNVKANLGRILSHKQADQFMFMLPTPAIHYLTEKTGRALSSACDLCERQ